MKSFFTAAAFALATTALLASCARHADGRRMTLGEHWKAMAARQDAAARAFVDTSHDHTNPNPSGPRQEQRSAFAAPGASF